MIKTSAASYDYGWIAVKIKGYRSDLIRNIAKGIALEDIHDEEGYGVETDPHVTVLYGIHDGEKEKVDALLSVSEPVNIKGVELGVFENDDYDVLHIRVQSEQLCLLNETLRNGVEYTSSFPDYNPHMTVAYMKKGTGVSYAETLPFTSFIYSADSMIYENSDKSEVSEYSLYSTAQGRIASDLSLRA